MISHSAFTFKRATSEKDDGSISEAFQQQRTFLLFSSRTVQMSDAQQDTSL